MSKAEFIDLLLHINNNNPKLEVPKEDERLLLDCFKFAKKDVGGTFLFLACHNSKDTVKKISCKEYTPLAGYAYDSLSDAYLYSCYDYVTLGKIPVSYYIESVDYPSWTVRIPLPVELIFNYIDSNQKKMCEDFVSKYSDLRTSFIQMVL